MVGKGHGMKVVLAHGPAGLFDFFPLLFLGAGAWIIMMVLRDGAKKHTQTRRLPTNPWSRQVQAATRKRGGDRSTGPSSDRPSRRFGPPPRLRVMEGEAAEGNRPAVPRTFQPPPPSRRKTG